MRRADPRWASGCAEQRQWRRSIRRHSPNSGTQRGVLIRLIAAAFIAFAIALSPVRPAAVEELPEPDCVDLIADGGGNPRPAGAVCVSNDLDNLEVTYATTGGWTMLNSHLALSTGEPRSGQWLAEKWQNRAGGVVPGQFPYKVAHEPPVDDSSFTIPLADISGGAGPGDVIFIAASATVEKDSEVQAAWADAADGERFRANHWATWFTYEVPDLGPPAVVRGSVEQVYLYGADANTPATIYDPAGQPVQNDSLPWSVGSTSFTPGGDSTDHNGALVFRGTLDETSLAFSGIEPGDGYTVEYVKDGLLRISDPVRVLAPGEHPDQALYDGQELEEGLTYIETRDGTLLSAYVTLPGPAANGPYPTLIEYSGYNVSQPPDLSGGLPINTNAPTLTIGQLLGYATVAVNIRGTGCSGGAFDHFETLQSLDGYDAVETVAAQPWSAGVGTTGVSYPGIAQLFLASTQPPSLAAAAPMAVISDHARDVVAPGGIYNTGFAQEWAAERERDTRFPGGQSWVDQIVGTDAQGAAQCAENVQLRGQNLPLLDRIEANEFATDLWDTRSPFNFAENVTTNLFIVNSWQDEQTGGRGGAALLDALDLDRDDRVVRFVGTNGTHVETLGPEILTDLIEFIELYVARRTPAFTERSDFVGIRALAPLLYAEILGDFVPASQITIPEDRFTGMTHEEALAAYESEPPARILFQTGAGDGPDGFPFPAFSHRFEWDQLPNLAALTGAFDAGAATWFLQPDGTLGPVPPGVELSDTGDRSSYIYDPAVYPPYSFASRPSNSHIWRLQPSYQWLQPPDGNALSYVTPAFEQDHVLVGSASVDLWLQTDNPLADTDVEVVLSEIRPDGTEMYVTVGWLRGSKRAIENSENPLRPRPTFRLEDVVPLEPGEWHELRVETFPFGQVFRAGSRLRLTIEAPGGNRPTWRFDDTIAGGPDVTNQIAHNTALASKLVLPLVAVDLGDLPAHPACTPSDGGVLGMTAVRGQPCRAAPPELAPEPGAISGINLTDLINTELGLPGAPGRQRHGVEGPVYPSSGPVQRGEEGRQHHGRRKDQGDTSNHLD